MPKPRIAVVSPFIDKRHGTERTVAECLQRLASDYEIHVYSNRVEDVDLATITWHRIPALPGPHLFAYMWWFLANRIWRWRDEHLRGLRPEVVFSPGVNCFDADTILVHVVFGRFRERMKHQLNFHRNPWKTWPRILHRRIYYRLISSLERRIYSRPEIPLVAVSRKTADDLSHFYGRVAGVSIAYIGLDFDRFQPARRLALREDARRTLGVSKDQFALLLIGNDWKSKGLPSVLEAAGQLQEADICILVAGNDNRTPFESAIERHGLAGRVHFLPSRADVEFYYAAADVYASPTLEDAFALPPAEAMACGLPVVTSRNNGGAEIISTGEDGFVLEQHSDFLALAQILRQLMENPEFRERVGKNAVATARKLTWDETAAHLRASWEEARRLKRVSHPEKMIIGLFTEMLSPGGVQRAGRQTAAVIAEFAAARGDQHIFLSLNDPQGAHTLPFRSGEFRVEGFARDKFQFVAAALRAAGQKPQLVIALHPHLAPVVALMRLRSQRFRSIIFTHGIEVWQPLGWPRGSAFRQADLVTAPSADTAQHLISDQGILPRKVQRLPWGLDAEFEERIRTAPIPSRPASFPEQARIILTVGRWDPAERYKGADTLIAALPHVLRAVPEAFLVLVGDGGDRPRLEQLAREQGVADRACFLHGLTQQELFACYAHCDVFALPSSGEGFGLVFLEAMAHGKPVVGGAHGGIPDVVDERITGLLVPHGDVPRLSAALESLLSDQAYAREMGARGRERVHSLYSSEEFRSRLIWVLQNVLNT